jgi:hypothetical protein
MDRHETIGFAGIPDNFEISKSVAKSSTKLEGYLPGLIAGIWLLILVSSLLVIIAGWTGI